MEFLTRFYNVAVRFFSEKENTPDFIRQRKVNLCVNGIREQKGSLGYFRRVCEMLQEYLGYNNA